MAIESICSGCGQRLKAEDERLGEEAKCPVCHQTYVIGESQDPESSPGLQGSLHDTLYHDSSVPSSSASNELSTSKDGVQAEIKQADVQGSVSNSAGGIATPFESIEAAALHRVMTPDGKVYGPIDPDTVLSWYRQNRLNDNCQIADNQQENWEKLGTWLRRQFPNMESNASSLPKGQKIPTATLLDQSGMPYQVQRRQHAALALFLAIASFAVNMCGIGWILAIIALVMGIHGQQAIKAGHGDKSQKGLLTAAQILAGLSLILSVLQWPTFFFWLWSFD